MTTTIQVKRHQTGAALTIGTAPLKSGAGGLLPGEMVNDEVANILYVAIGNDGNGNSTSIIAIAGGGAFLRLTQLGAANGAASLDSTGKLPASQLPASITGAMVYQGTWNPQTNTNPQLLSGQGTKGYFYKLSATGVVNILSTNASANSGATTLAFASTSGVTVGMLVTGAGIAAGTTVTALTGTQVTLSTATTAAIASGAQITFASYLDGVSGTNFQIGDLVAFDGTTWDKIDGPAEAVISVAGRVGAIILKAADISDAGTFGIGILQAANRAALMTYLGLTVSDVSGAAPLASPALTGTPTAPTAGAGTNSTQLATTAFVTAAVNAATPSTIDGGVI